MTMSVKSLFWKSSVTQTALQTETHADRFLAVQSSIINAPESRSHQEHRCCQRPVKAKIAKTSDKVQPVVQPKLHCGRKRVMCTHQNDFHRYGCTQVSAGVINKTCFQAGTISPSPTSSPNFKPQNHGSYEYSCRNSLPAHNPCQPLHFLKTLTHEYTCRNPTSDSSLSDTSDS